MVINNTTEFIEIFLSTPVLSQEATFFSSFNDISASTMTPNQTNGTTSGTTAVTIMGSPSSSSQRQLREFCLYNRDSREIDLTVRFNNSVVTRTLFRSKLGVNQSLIYEIETGWGIFDIFGKKILDDTHVVQTGSIRVANLTLLPNIASTSSIASTNIPAISLGKAERAYSSITVSYNVVTTAATMTWAEIGIYKVVQPMGIGTTQYFYRLGVLDTTSIWNTTGVKVNTIVLTGTCREGDDLYFMMGHVAAISATFRSGNISEDSQSALRSINTTGGNLWRLSRSNQQFPTVFNNSIASILVAWQGN